MLIEVPLAHSARRGRPTQSYAEHVANVTARAYQNAVDSTAIGFGGNPNGFVQAVKEAAAVHDLGKLDQANQDVLHSEKLLRLPVNHVDAGVYELLLQKRLESAILAQSHHVGLPALPAEVAKGKSLFLRDPATADHTQLHLPSYLEVHERETGHRTQPTEPINKPFTGLSRRLALSCLVDADHGDTARHYGCVSLPFRATAWQRRLDKLDEYVAQLSSGDSGPRAELRAELYQTCRDAPASPISYVDAPVGSGKTTAVMSYLLKVAAEKGLRHVFCILPYVNIINQSAHVYRTALALDGEEPEEVVASHHHQADFSSLELRDLAMLWNAPITVTTAVQFFETLGSCRPSRLRKLHQLAGSAVFVDESHAALPSWLWPQTWRWLQELIHDWGCHFVLASGSLSRFWEHKNFGGEARPLLSEDLQRRLHSAERQRVQYRRASDPMSLTELVRFVEGRPGPRLVVLNTVQAAATTAHEMRTTGRDVIHLSTSLAPQDRGPILEKVRQRLLDTNDRSWSLVATSCVEAGVDLSFRTAVRESCSVASLVQIGGRVNRHGEHDVAEVWDIRLRDRRLKQHPLFEGSRTVLMHMWRENLLNQLSATELTTEATRRELLGGYAERTEEIAAAERTGDYPKVDLLCRVIDSETVLVVVYPELAEELRRGSDVSPSRLLKGSVQIWRSKIDSLPVVKIRESEELLQWTGRYDADFLGYMADNSVREAV